MKTISKALSFVVTMAVVLLLSGCMASQTALSHHSLEVNTKMTNSVFLQPTKPSEKVVYLAVSNTSDQPSMNSLKPALVQDLRVNGYQVVNDPSKAHYLLQVNVLQAGKKQPSGKQNVVDGALSGGLVGGTTGALIDNANATDIAVGAVAGAAAGTLANTLIKDVSYTLTTDVQISERTTNDIHANTKSTVSNGSSSKTTLTSNNTTQWQKYRTKVISSAEKMNLKFDEASPQLVTSMAHTIAGIFS